MGQQTNERRRDRRAIGAAALAATLLLAGCGGGSEEPAAEDEATTTTAAAEQATTTTTAPEAEQPAGLPTEEADAPSGSWIGLRSLVAVEPEPEGTIIGATDARIYEIEPECDDEGCTLVLAPGGEDGSFSLPGTQPITGEPLELEPEGDAWKDVDEPAPFGCSAELDGPYVASTETREVTPVYGDDGAIIGLLGSVYFEDVLTDEGREAGCPAEAEATYGYTLLLSPSDHLETIEDYEVDGTFRQTLEVTAAENQVPEFLQVGGISTTFPEYDIDLAGACAGGECDVAYEALNGDDEPRETTLTAGDDGGLVGEFQETGSCVDDAGAPVADDAYDGVGTYEDLYPVWVEDGRVKAFVGRYAYTSTPNEVGQANEACAATETLEGWVYLVEREVFDG